MLPPGQVRQEARPEPPSSLVVRAVLEEVAVDIPVDCAEAEAVVIT